MESFGLSVILPCYNQASVLPDTLVAFRRFFTEADIPFEIIVVNDGSTDTTAQLLHEAQDVGVRVYTHTKPLGQGRAIQTGVLAARYSMTLFLDPDPMFLPQAEESVRTLQNNPRVDLVMAPGCVSGRTRNMQELFLFLRCERLGFVAELFYVARLWGLGIQELKCGKDSKMSSERKWPPSLIDLIKIRWRAFFGWYQKTLYSAASAQNITLDDFGISALVNERILQVVQHPRVARVAVMAQGTFPPNFVELLEKSGKKIDIHLELPVLRSEIERALHGKFLERVIRFVGALWEGELHIDQVEKSWRTQIETFRELFGHAPDGINSHEHTHFFPPFYALSLRLAREYKIPFVRVGRQGTSGFHPVIWVLNILRSIDRLFFGKPRATSRVLLHFDWGIHPKYHTDATAEILYHIERDEEWVHF